MEQIGECMWLDEIAAELAALLSTVKSASAYYANEKMELATLVRSNQVETASFAYLANPAKRAQVAAAFANAAKLAGTQTDDQNAAADILLKEFEVLRECC